MILVVVLVAGAGFIYVLESTHRSLIPAPSPGTSSIAFPTPVQHEIVIFMENHAQSDVLASGPFERHLAQEYAFAAGFRGVTYDSLQDYAYANSGSYYFGGSSVPELVDHAGESWAAYMQGMPTPCDRLPSADGLYNPNHDPFVFYNYVTSSPAYCASHVLPLTAWNQSIAAGTLPNYVFITPDMTNDSDNVSAAIGDAWLHGFLTPFLNSSLFASSAVMLTYDSNAIENPPPGTLGNGLVYFSLISPYAHRNYTSANLYSDPNLLTTTEWLLGLGRTNHNDNWAVTPPMVDLFDFGPTYSVSGSVTYQGSPVAGAQVSGSGYLATADAAGAYSFSVPNGTYVLQASSPTGTCLTSSSTVTVSGGNVSLRFDLPCT